MDSRIKLLRAKAKELDPVGFIGKAGITDKVVEELQRQLKAKKLIKVRVAKDFYGADKKSAAQGLADKVGADLIDRIGYVIVLAKKKSRTSK